MPTNIVIKNTNTTSTLRVKRQDAVVDEKNKKTGKWEDVAADAYIPPNQFLDVWVSPERRFLVEEMPS